MRQRGERLFVLFLGMLSVVALEAAEAREALRGVESASERLRWAVLETRRAGAWEASKYTRQTTVLGCVRDRFGDPLYCTAGPRGYTGTPYYCGPAYRASFAWVGAGEVPDTRYRGYLRQGYAHPHVTARTDVTLGVDAAQLYLQSGMLMNPGSMVPSAARVMINNSYY